MKTSEGAKISTHFSFIHVHLFAYTLDIQQQDGTLASFSIKIPQFMQTDSNGCFVISESQFALSKITNSETKFYYVLSFLHPDTISKL